MEWEENRLPPADAPEPAGRRSLRQFARRRTRRIRRTSESNRLGTHATVRCSQASIFASPISAWNTRGTFKLAKRVISNDQEVSPLAHDRSSASSAGVAIAPRWSTGSTHKTVAAPPALIARRQRRISTPAPG